MAGGRSSDNAAEARPLPFNDAFGMPPRASGLAALPPWLVDDARRLLQRELDDRFPHALLLTGVDGVGKRAFAAWLAEALLCLERVDAGGADVLGACGQCAACHQLAAGTHPDLALLAPEGRSETIRIDAVRVLMEWLQLTPGAQSRRVALVTAADRMNRNAANSLLKTLEEPAEGAVLILTASQLGRLPATVRSRCQRMLLRPGEGRVARDWLLAQPGIDEAALAEHLLEACADAPFAAIRRSARDALANFSLLQEAWLDLFLHRRSIGRIVSALTDLPREEILRQFAAWSAQAARVSLLQEQSGASGANPAVDSFLAETAPILEIEHWFSLHQQILELHRTDSVSFRTQTVLEGLFADIRSGIQTRQASRQAAT